MSMLDQEPTKFKCKKHGIVSYFLAVRMDENTTYFCGECLGEFLKKNIGILESIEEDKND